MDFHSKLHLLATNKLKASIFRPKLSPTEAEGIPLIDLSALNSNSSSLEPLVAEIGDACENWGFFQVINHGVPQETRRKFDSASRKFFALPTEEKRKVRRDEATRQGYYDTEHTKNVRDWKEVFDLTVKNPTVVPASPEPDDEEVIELVNRWPEYPPELREAYEEYAKILEKLAYKLVELISLSLGLPVDRLSGFFNNHTSFIRRYVGGLEVKRKTDGEWIGVKPTPHAFIVNIGAIIQVWSNGRYESVEHRVIVNSKKERLSIPFFFNPDHYVMVEPLKELTTDQNPARYKAYNWGKFFANRTRSDLKKLNVENIQVHHFKINGESS
ncbi:hypothetical protein U1Q18_034954 [Sarracenia purpurea var. burkii]